MVVSEDSRILFIMKVVVWLVFIIRKVLVWFLVVRMFMFRLCLVFSVVICFRLDVLEVEIMVLFFRLFSVFRLVDFLDRNLLVVMNLVIEKVIWF